MIACHISVFLYWIGIGWVEIALAECTTICVICGSTLSGESQCLTLSGAFARYTADWEQFHVEQLHWEQIHWEQIHSKKFQWNKFRAPRRGQWARDLGNAQVKTHWCILAPMASKTLSGSHPQVQLRRGRHLSIVFPAARIRRYNCVGTHYFH